MNQAFKVAFGILSITLVCALGLYAQQKMQTPLLPPAPMPLEPETNVALPAAPVSSAPVLSPADTKDLIASLSTSTTSTSTAHPTTPIVIPALPVTHEEEHVGAGTQEQPSESTAHHDILSKLESIDSRLLAIESTLQNLAQELLTVAQPPAEQPAVAHPEPETKKPATPMHEPENNVLEEGGLGLNDHGPMEEGMHAINNMSESLDESENNWDF